MSETQISCVEPFTRLALKCHSKRLAMVRIISIGYRWRLDVDASDKVILANDTIASDEDVDIVVLRDISARKEFS